MTRLISVLFLSSSLLIAHGSSCFQVDGACVCVFHTLHEGPRSTLPCIIQHGAWLCSERSSRTSLFRDDIALAERAWEASETQKAAMQLLWCHGEGTLMYIERCICRQYPSAHHVASTLYCTAGDHRPTGFRGGVEATGLFWSSSRRAPETVCVNVVMAV